jgi:hypothetical protein
VTDARLALAHQLVSADEATAAELTELEELAASVDAVGARSVALQELQARHPQERAARARAVEEAEGELAAAVDAAARAEEGLRAAETDGDRELIAAARRFRVRARDARSMAERRLKEARARQEELEEQAAGAEREAAGVERRAQELSRALRELPRLTADAGEHPATGLAGVADWATRARAALLVARSQLSAEREALIRQANELGSVVAGESLEAVSTAAVARRVERELEGS